MALHLIQNAWQIGDGGVVAHAMLADGDATRQLRQTGSTPRARRTSPAARIAKTVIFSKGNRKTMLRSFILLANGQK